MVGVIVVTHGQFGKYLLEAAQTILGPQEQCAHVAVEGAVDVGGVLGRRTDAGIARIRAKIYSATSACTLSLPCMSASEYSSVTS